MLIVSLFITLLFVRCSHAVLDEIICHNDLLQRKTHDPGVSGTRNDRISNLMERAFAPELGRKPRHVLAGLLSLYNYPAVLTRLWASPQPLEHPMTAGECLDAVSLIPHSSPHLDPNNPGTHTRLNIVYSDTQRQRILQYRLDAIFVAGNCAVQIIRRPGRDHDTNGLRHADATAMALVVYPHAREKALAVIEQCLFGPYRFGYVGTKSVLKGLDFDYVVVVTLWPGDSSLMNPGEHCYNRNGEIQAPNDDPRRYGGITSFPFKGAFN